MIQVFAHHPGLARGSWRQLLAGAASLVLACGAEPERSGGGEPAGSESPSSTNPDEEAERVPVPSLDVPLATLLGGQSGVEGGCALLGSLENVMPHQYPDGFDYRVSDVLGFIEGTRTAELRWAAIDPPGGNASPEELTVEVSLVGLAIAQYGCGNSYSFPVSYHLRSASGALELEGLGTMYANRQHASLSVDFPSESLPSWLAAASPVLNMTAGVPGFSLFLAFTSDQTVRGNFAARGTGLCTLAAWPVEPTCPDGRALDVDDPSHGARVSELFQLVQPLSIPGLSFSDGTLSELSLSIESPPQTACTRLDLAGNGFVRPGTIYEAPLQLRLTSADGRIDVVVPAKASALWSAGEWSEPGFFTDGPVLAPSGGFGQLVLEPLGLSGRPALLLSGRRAEGDLRIYSFAPHSAALRDVLNAGCINVPATLVGQEFAGVLSDVLSARWP